MTGSSTSRPFGARQRGAAPVRFGLREAVDLLRPPARQRAGVRTDRVDVRAAVIAVLVEQPADGYRIVRTLEERGAGERTPGAGAVYPMLQLLVDEGLATVADDGGRKVYSLTVSGRVAAEAAQDRPIVVSSTGAPERRGALAKAGAQLAQAAALVAQTGTREQIAEAIGVLDDARRRLYAVLARN